MDIQSRGPLIQILREYKTVNACVWEHLVQPIIQAVMWKKKRTHVHTRKGKRVAMLFANSKAKYFDAFSINWLQFSLLKVL